MLEVLSQEVSFHSILEGRESSMRGIKKMPLVVLIVSIRLVSPRISLVISKGCGWHRKDAQGRGNQELPVMGHTPNIEILSE